MISQRLVERLIVYKNILEKQSPEAVDTIYSHTLAEYTNFTPSQVRKDLMVIGCSGNQKLGYRVKELTSFIKNYLTLNKQNNMILIGAGNLGKALLHYFSSSRNLYKITACFDVNEDLIGNFIYYTKCYPMEELELVIKKNNIKSAIITTPPETAQELTDNLIRFGIKGIINFTTFRLKAPENVFIENIDFSASVEKAVFFVNQD